MSNHSVIEHRANYHYVKIEEDYIAICLGGEASPHCKALILSILENWTNTKRDKGEEPIVYMTYPQWVQAMYWQHGRNVVIESLEELEKQGLITRKPYRFKGKDTFAYVLNVQAVQECIKQLPEKSPQETLPRFNLNAFKNKRVPNQTRPKSNGTRVYNQTPDAFNNIPFIDSITQNQNIDSLGEICTTSEPAPVVDFTTVQSTPLVEINSHSHLSTPSPQDAPPENAGTHVSEKVPASMFEMVPPVKKKPVARKEPKPALTPEEEALNDRCSTLQAKINEWRGYALSGQGPVVNERKRIRDLVEKYSDEKIERIYRYLFSRHWKWSKPDNRYKIGAQILWEESQSVLQILKEEAEGKRPIPFPAKPKPKDLVPPPFDPDAIRRQQV